MGMLAALLVPGVYAKASNDNGGLGFIDTEKKGTLKIYYNFKDYGEMSGIKAHVYRIATVSETGEFTLVAPFDSLGLDITEMSSISTHEQWKTITTKLKNYVSNNSVSTYAEATSGSDGFADLGTVETGLYYGYSDPIEINGAKYIYYDVIAPVPGPIMLDEHGNSDWDGTWKNAAYDVITIPKRESVKVGGDPEEFTVFKQWVDKGYEKDRPKSIKVKIYCDGELFDTVELSSKNNWQYSWKYEKGHTFTVEEEVDGKKYNVMVSEGENSFVIVNSRKPQTPPDSPPGGDDTPNPGSDTPTPNGGGDTPGVLGAIRKMVGELPAVLGARRLPQTGQLWWPIPVLAILGIILIGVGIRSEKRRKKSE